MPVNAGVAVRSGAVGVAAALVVVGAYAWGHGSASATPSAQSGQSGQSARAGSASLLVSSDTPSPSGGGISVSGVGTVSGTPNMLRLQTSIDVTRPDVNTALHDANATMAAVQHALKADGVAAADLQTSGLSVQPNYAYSNNTTRLNGYTVSENLTVVLRDLSKAGTTINDAAQAGGDSLRIGGASLDLSGDDALVAQARQKAFGDALAKATAYAKAAGRALGPVTSISETQDSSPQPYYYKNFGMSASAPAAPVPVEAGSQDVTVNISVTWSLS